MPKVLHTTWKFHALLNKKWIEIEKKCMQANPDFIFCHWDDDDLLNLVIYQYGNLLEKFLSYPYPIQRADVGRYLLLKKFGGFYKDTNIGCRAPFDYIYHNEIEKNRNNVTNETAKVLFAKIDPIGVAGDFIASTRDHPIFEQMITELGRRRTNYFLPYLDVMLSTGPLFLSHVVNSFKGNPNISLKIRSEVFLIETKSYQFVYFYFVSGSTWHCVDGVVIWWVFTHLKLLFVCALLFKLFCIFALINKSKTLKHRIVKRLEKIFRRKGN
ncbi:hypothetical protein HELRODRAFT_85985 [Helobdella robusta]|uniref:Uncharacterized protein n=1 Tax=Helobdella robusta TaxID=6412 RepID=T1G656_HELRO|nr:hypothetical protein HELRODRAFT_85985 [Helobdella robusta]ESN96959.1 hypothetical protein HELRODRAFT_85985 [Helobdella robusta]